MFVSLCSTRRATPTASCCRKQKQSSLHQQHSVQSPVTIHKLPNKKKKNLAKAILLAFVLGWWLWMLLTGSSPVFGGHLIQTSNDSDHPLPWLIVPSETAASVPTDRHNNRAQNQQQHKTTSQYVRYNKRGKLVMKAMSRVTLADLLDVTDDLLLKKMENMTTPSHDDNDAVSTDPTSHHNDPAKQDKHPILDLLHRAGIKELDRATLSLLPTASEVTHLYGPSTLDEQQPLLVAGRETCAKFRRSIPPGQQAYLGVAGLFNSGTNALLYYLRANLVLPVVAAQDNNNKNSTISTVDNTTHGGILTQVPWHKHWFSRLRANHTIALHRTVPKEYVMPIVVIRDPLTWMQTMCRAPYLVESYVLVRGDEPISQDQPLSSVRRRLADCPSLTRGNPAVQIPAMMSNMSWPTLLHLWKDWYNDYIRSNQPYLMVRWEDLVFRPRDVVNVIRHCTGAIWKESSFVHVVDQAKWEHVRELGPQSNWISAMIKHAHPPRRWRRLTAADWNLARSILYWEASNASEADEGDRMPWSLVRRFHYQLPRDS